MKTLNRGIFFDVLYLLPTKSLVRFRSIYKEWQCLISMNGFVKIHLKIKEPISGFFFLETYKWNYVAINTISYILVKERGVK